MEDEFLFYLENKLADLLIASFDNVDVLAWGVRSDKDVELLGVTVNIGVRHLQDVDHATDKRILRVIQSAYLLSQKSRSALFTIVYPRFGDDCFKVTNPDDPLNWFRSIVVRETEMPNLIQKFFGTNLNTAGTVKPVNKATSDWFHVWARINLPREYVRTNIDGLWLDNKRRPRILLETKRSSYTLDSWDPRMWQQDSRNYCLQHHLANRAGLKFWTVYHIKGEDVREQTHVTLFEVFDVFLDGRSDWICFRRTKTTAEDLLRKMQSETT